MSTRIVFRRVVALLCLTVLCVGAVAGETARQFVPYSGMPGKDVIWLPADLVLMNRMLELAGVGPGDVVVDLGSGDGRTVIGAAKHGARGIGVELNADLVNLSRSYAEQEGVAERTRFVVQDLFEFDLSQASVVTLFLLPAINMKLRPALLELKPGTRVVSNTFTMEDWTHDGTTHDAGKPDCDLNFNVNCIAYLWVVPAKVAGTWRLARGELRLAQRFQMLTGTLSAGGKSVEVAGRLRGDRITITAADTVVFSGRVAGTEMGGTVRINGVPNGWRAVRTGN